MSPFVQTLGTGPWSFWLSVHLVRLEALGQTHEGEGHAVGREPVAGAAGPRRRPPAQLALLVTQTAAAPPASAAAHWQRLSRRDTSTGAAPVAQERE